MSSVFKSAIAQNIGTTDVTVYTVPALTTTTIIGLSLCNTTGQGVTSNIKVTKGATTVHMLKSVPIPNGSTVIAVGGDQKVVLEAGDILKVSSSAATSIDAILSVLELA